MDEKTARESFERALAAHEPKFEKFFLSSLIGLEFSYTQDSCTIEFEVADFMFNPQGSLHGGIIATVMDISMGHLIHHRTGRGAATIETCRIFSTRPSSGGFRQVMACSLQTLSSRSFPLV